MKKYDKGSKKVGYMGRFKEVGKIASHKDYYVN